MDTAKATILVADDDPSILLLIRATLESEGYEVVCASDGETAVRAFDERQPDLMVLDVMMPGRDGYAVLGHARESSDIPVVFLTARSEAQDMVHGLVSGADDYVTKPFSARLLLAKVKAILRRTGP